MKTIARNGKALEEQTNPICASDYKDPDIVAYSLETFHCTSEEEKTTTLKARDYKDPIMVAYGVDCRNMNETPELYPTLQAKPNGGQSLNYSGALRVQHIVRRLTPTECARLQGFPDTWGHPTQKTELTDEEYQFWLNVRNTHAAINDKTTKQYTKDQMLKWYNGLHTDSNEYKMWGNGIALPNALYMMQGIADVMSEEKAARRKWLDDLLGGCL
jgi:DNA (cytosine-5)-methyltransferase 1